MSIFLNGSRKRLILDKIVAPISVSLNSQKTLRCISLNLNLYLYFSTLLDVFVFLFGGPPFLFLIDYFTIAFGLLYHIIKNWLLKNGSMSFYQQHEIFSNNFYAFWLSYFGRLSVQSLLTIF